MTRPVTEIAASPDGRWIVTVDAHGAQLLASDDMAPRANYVLPRAFRAAFAPDGTRLAIRTETESYAFTVPDLRPTLRERLYGGNDILAYGPAFTDSETLALPTGTLRPLC